MTARKDAAPKDVPVENTEAKDANTANSNHKQETEGKVAGNPGGDTTSGMPSSALPADEEVPARSADVDADKSNTYVKKFVTSVPWTDADWADYDHLPNATATVQDLINLGMRAKGDVQFDGVFDSTQPGDGVVLQYSVEVIPAHIQPDSEYSISPSDLVEAETDDAENIPDFDEAKDAADKRARNKG